MAFKLKSPFHKANVQTVAGVEYGQQRAIPDSSQRVEGMESSMFNPTADGEQELKTEPKGNKEIDDLAKKADEGIPLGLNPKQEMRYKIRQDKRKLRGVEREKRQTAKAEKMSERYFGNKFGMTNMDLAKKRLDIYEDQSKKLEDIDAQGKVVDKELSSLNMEGKINRAGGPIKMLKSMEDNTPAKYKSVKKASKENLMSSLAKKGEPIKGDFTYEPGSHYDKKDFGTGNINTKSGKAKITKTKPKGKGGKVKMDRKVPTKF